MYVFIVCFWGIFLQLMVTGVHGSRGENAPLPVGAERGHVSVSAIVRLPATVVGRVQETPLSCPGVTLRHAQVKHSCKYILYMCAVERSTRSILKYFLFLLGGPQKARGSIIGNINDIEFGIAIINATITDSKSGGKIIKATITNVPRTLGQFSQYFHMLKSHTFICNVHQIIPASVQQVVLLNFLNKSHKG